MFDGRWSILQIYKNYQRVAYSCCNYEKITSACYDVGGTNHRHLIQNWLVKTLVSSQENNHFCGTKEYFNLSLLFLVTLVACFYREDLRKETHLTFSFYNNNITNVTDDTWREIACFYREALGLRKRTLLNFYLPQLRHN